MGYSSPTFLFWTEIQVLSYLVLPSHSADWKIPERFADPSQVRGNKAGFDYHTLQAWLLEGAGSNAGSEEGGLKPIPTTESVNHLTDGTDCRALQEPGSSAKPHSSSTLLQRKGLFKKTKTKTVVHFSLECMVMFVLQYYFSFST